MKISLAFFLALITSTVGAASLPTMAIVDFDSRFDRTLNTIIPNVLTENLINSGRFAFFERERLDAILREQGLQTSGNINPATAVSLGNLSGIDFILTGEIVDFGREVRSFSGYGVRTDTVFYRLEAAVRIFETGTGRIVFSRTERAEEKQNQGAGIVVSDTTIDTRLGRIVGQRLTASILSAPVFQEAEEEEDATASITITSEPANASVEIDGIFYGNAGNEFELSSGLHQIKVSLPGYEVWDKKVMVRDGASFHVPLVRAADVRVEVDEKSKITTESVD